MVRNERFIGSTEEVERIRKSLEIQRRTVPLHIKNHICLKNAKANPGWGVDWKLFKTVTHEAERHFKSIDRKFSLVQEERYLMTKANEDSIGGFYGQPSGGYYYMNDLGFGTILNEDLVPSKKLRTLEFARSYLHDSLHSCTFRTFRADGDDIYRHQYGINFRNVDRTSYSAPNLNEKSPNAVNLNTWMDALVHMQASELLKTNFSQEMVGETLNDFEKEVWKEVTDMTFDKDRFSDPMQFHTKVIVPARDFMEKWGKVFLVDETLKSMLTGDLGPLRTYFKQKQGREDAWEAMFRQSAYQDI